MIVKPWLFGYLWRTGRALNMAKKREVNCLWKCFMTTAILVYWKVLYPIFCHVRMSLRVLITSFFTGKDTYRTLTRLVADSWRSWIEKGGITILFVVLVHAVVVLYISMEMQVNPTTNFQLHRTLVHILATVCPFYQQQRQSERDWDIICMCRNCTELRS